MSAALVLRPSALVGFFECPYKWFRDYLAPTPRSFTASAKAHIGTAIHKSAELYINDCIRAGAWANPTNSAYADGAMASLLNKFTDEPPQDGEIGDAEAKVKDTYLYYLQALPSLCDGAIPIATELNLEYRLNAKTEKPLVLKGTIDIVTERGIADIKTMSRKKDPKNYTLQQGAYGLLRELNDPKAKVESLDIHRVIVGGLGAIDKVSLGDAQAIMLRTRHHITQIARTIEAFEKNPQLENQLWRGNCNSWLCSAKWCGYYADCEWRI